MRYPAYPAYNDSGVEWVGDFPAHWNTQRQRNVADLLVSNVDKHTLEGEYPVRLCNYVDVYKNERITSAIPFSAATATVEEIGRFRLRAGDVLITKDSESWDDIAVPALVEYTAPDLVCGYHLAILRAKEGVLDSNYLFRVQQSQPVRTQYHVSANGITRYGLSHSAIRNVLLPVPPLPEQAAIAAFLDRETATIAALIARQARLITLLGEKRQALIAHAVTKGLRPDAPMKDSGVPWLGEIPAHWDVKRLKNCITSLSQGWSPQCENRPAEEGEWGVLKVGCVNKEEFNAQENKALPTTLQPITEYALSRSDVLISRANTRELVGSAALVTRGYPQLLLCDKLYRLRCDESSCLPAYAVRLLRTSVARSQFEIDATGASSSMLNISQETVRNLVFAFPPVEEQNAIVCYIASSTEQIDTLIAKAQQAIALMREHCTSLITAAVTGKIDVRGAIGGGAAAEVEDGALVGVAR